MAFEGLSEKLNETFKRLRGKGRLTESDVKAGLREVRLALLEADVSYKVVKDFIAKVTDRCVGSDVLESLTPAQQIVKMTFFRSHRFFPAQVPYKMTESFDAVNFYAFYDRAFRRVESGNVYFFKTETLRGYYRCQYPVCRPKFPRKRDLSEKSGFFRRIFYFSLRRQNPEDHREVVGGTFFSYMRGSEVLSYDTIWYRVAGIKKSDSDSFSRLFYGGVGKPDDVKHGFQPLSYFGFDFYLKAFEPDETDAFYFA